MDKEKCKNPICKNELVHTDGRRKKKYCSAACKNKINLANYYERNKKEGKTIKIPIEEYKKMLEQIVKKKGGAIIDCSNVDIFHKDSTENVIPRIKGESSLEYRIRCIELNNSTNEK